MERTFYASHQLTLPDGSKEALHSHDWRVKANVASERLNEMGLVMDFLKLGRVIDDAVRPLADSKMEDLPFFRNTNASAENLARYIYEEVKFRLKERVQLESVEVMETPGCWARYDAD